MKKLNTIALVSIFGILISCEHKKEENKWDWKNITGNINTSGLTTLYMLDDEIGYVGGFSNIETKKTINHYSGSFNDSIILKPNEHYYIYHEFEDTFDITPCLYKTINGGESWNAIHTPFRIGVCDIHFVDEEVGYISTCEEGVYKTTDGGKNWSRILSNLVHYYNGLAFVNPFNSLVFLDESTGFAYDKSGNSDLVVKTKDGGISWSVVSVSYDPGISGKHPSIFDNLQKIVFPNLTDTGYVLNGTKLYKTVDKGENWNLIHDKKEPPQLKISFFNTQIFYLINANKVTMDGGITWTSLDFPLKDELNLENIVFYYYYEDNIVRVIPKTAYHKMTIEVNTYIKDLFFPSNSVGYAIGASHILKYNKYK